MFAHRNDIVWDLLELAFFSLSIIPWKLVSRFYTLKVTFFFNHPNSKSKVQFKDSRYLHPFLKNSIFCTRRTNWGEKMVFHLWAKKIPSLE